MIFHRIIRTVQTGLVLAFMLSGSICKAKDIVIIESKLSSAIRKESVEGVVVLYSKAQNTTYLSDVSKAKESLSPASTFKIANSIIALETEVIKDQYEIIPWNGTKYEIDLWNNNQNMKSAYKASCLWFYQNLAKKIGKKRYQKYLTEFLYGNSLIGPKVTNFWLAGGDLLISPLEQIDFLKRLNNKSLGLSKRTYYIMDDVMLEEGNKHYKLYSKTGAATKNWKGHGWYVGYAVTESDTWFFATNIIINSFDDLSKRKTVTMTALKEFGAI